MICGSGIAFVAGFWVVTGAVLTWIDIHGGGGK